MEMDLPNKLEPLKKLKAAIARHNSEEDCPIILRQFLEHKLGKDREFINGLIELAANDTIVFTLNQAKQIRVVMPMLPNFSKLATEYLAGAKIVA